jgi:hypothetical protein
LKQYLPIGTVVTLINGNKPLMIFGKNQTCNKNEDEIFDYVACLYPEGNISSEYNIFFNTSDIDKIIFRGCEL